MKKPSLTVTAILMKDEKDGGYTAYIEELPGIVAEGATEEELEENLREGIRFMLEVYKEEFENNMKEMGGMDKIYKRKSLELSVAAC